jgi:purine-binding chemotaxis protein CheW
MENQIVIFQLSNEYFGLNIAIVESIIKMQPITVIPHAPLFIKGVINLRGKVLPVIDLRKRFNMPPIESNKDSRIVVVALEGNEVGMMVDGVSEVLTIDEEEVEPAPCMVTSVDSSFIIGIAKIEGRLVMLLDLGKVFTAQEKPEFYEIPAMV